MLSISKRKKQRRPLSLTLEMLGARMLMAGDTAAAYAVPSDLANERSGGISFPRFGSEELLRRELIEAAVERYRDLFGTTQSGWWTVNDGHVSLDQVFTFASTDVMASRDHSNTNVQTAGVDEADLVKTDGNYIYFVDGQSLVIIDTLAAAELQVVSRIDLKGPASSIYLYGDQLTVITQRPHWSYANRFDQVYSFTRVADGASLRSATVAVAVYDITDRSTPRLLTETDFEGTLVQSRMIGSQVYVVAQQGLSLPGPITHPIDKPHTETSPTTNPYYDDVMYFSDPSFLPIIRESRSSYQYETEAEFRTRVADQILEIALPRYAAYGGQGQFLRAGRISNAGNIYDRDLVNYSALVSILTFDATGRRAGPQATTTVPAGNVSQIYASLDNLYVVESNTVDGQSVSDIYRLAFANGRVELAAIGEVPGAIINQFSLDEFQGHLRIATQSGWGQTARSAVYVLQINDLQMPVVGRLENLTPGERLFTSRFVGERGFLVTFGLQGQTGPNGERINPPNWVDPLLAIDLSDPTNPRLRGQLEIPGFSNYLHVVDGHYLIGFGRNADTATGRWLDPQVSVYDVADLDHPVQLGNFQIPLGDTVQSDAFYDHHAVSYFAEQHVLAIPMNTNRYEPIQDGLVTRYENRTYSNLWVFKIDPAAGVALQSLGTVDLHSPLRRSVRIEDELYSIAGEIIQANRLSQPDELLGQVYFGPLAFNTQFSVDRTSPTTTLDVLENFQLPDDIQAALQITAVTAPQFGQVTIAPDGKTLLYSVPADALARDDHFTYTVTDAAGRSEQGMASIRVSWQADSQRLLNLARTDVAARLGAPIEDVSAGRGRDSGWELPVREQVWADGSLATSEIPATDPTPGFEITVNYHGNWFIFHTDLGTRMLLVDEELVTRLDEYTPLENSTDNVLDVTRNDYLDNRVDLRQYRTPQLASVGSGNHGGTARLSDDNTQIIYTPAPNFVGVEQLRYTLVNGEVGTIKVRIDWGRLADGAVELALEDLAEKVGASLDSVKATTQVASIIQRVFPDNQIAVIDLDVLYENVWTPGFEIHLNYLGIDVEYHAVGDRAVQLAYAPLLFIADTFHVDENSIGIILDVQNNDFPGTGYTTRPLFSMVSASTAEGQVEMIANGSNRTIRYTPPANFSGIDTFSYASGNQTVPVTVYVDPAAQQSALRLVVKNRAGDPARHVNVGDEWVVEVQAIDQRAGQRGITAADLQLLFDPALANLQSVDYAAGASGNLDDAGVLHIKYAAPGVGSSQVTMATVRLHAVQTGILTLSTRFGTDGIVLAGPLGTNVHGKAAPTTAVVRLTESAPAVDQAVDCDIDQDGLVTPRDVLWLVYRLQEKAQVEIVQQKPQSDLATRLGFGFRLRSVQAFDPDNNGRLDPLDVLRVINKLNERAAAHDLVFSGF